MDNSMKYRHHKILCQELSLKSKVELEICPNNNNKKKIALMKKKR